MTNYLNIDIQEHLAIKTTCISLSPQTGVGQRGINQGLQSYGQIALYMFHRQRKSMVNLVPHHISPHMKKGTKYCDSCLAD